MTDHGTPTGPRATETVTGDDDLAYELHRLRQHPGWGACGECRRDAARYRRFGDNGSRATEDRRERQHSEDRPKGNEWWRCIPIDTARKWEDAARADAAEQVALLREALAAYVMSPHAYPLRDGHNDGFCRRCAAMYGAGMLLLTSEDVRPYIEAADAAVPESVPHRYDHDGAARHHHDADTGDPVWWQNAEELGGQRFEHRHPGVPSSYGRAVPESVPAAADMWEATQRAFEDIGDSPLSEHANNFFDALERRGWTVARAAASPAADGLDAARLTEAMDAAYTYEDDYNAVPTLPFVDDLDGFWEPFARLVAARLASPGPAATPQDTEEETL